MDVDAMCDESIPHPEEPLCSERDRPEIQVRADDVIGTGSSDRAERRRGKPRRADGTVERRASGQIMSIPAPASIIFSEKPQVVPELAQPRSEVTAESGDATPETGERRRPEMKLQDASGWGCRATGTLRRAGGEE